MNNYAIILGVDKYKYASALPSCENDANLMEGLLTATGKYEVLRIANNAAKHQIQEEISSFLPIDSTDIGEVLFYFSGHGKQDEQGMHYALCDTDVSKINSTSLNNSELDDIIRKCAPKLYVKIIDACQSGVAYIKGIDEIDGDFKCIEAKGFENCIFIYSSLKSQSSYAEDPYSKFTKAIIDAVESISAPAVKFTDIQNYLSDIFNSAGGIQTPYFSTQCDGTELFFEKNSNVLAYLQSLHPETPDINDNSQSNIDAVKAYLGKCRDDGDVKSMLEKIQDALNNWKLEHSFLNEFYEYECKTNFPYEYHRYHEDTSLVKMLHGRMDKENLFIEMEYTSVKKQNPLVESLFSNYKDIPVSYRSVANQLPSVFAIHFKALNGNLPDYVIPFIFVYSPTFFYVFTCTKQFVRKGWKEYENGRYTKYVYTKFEYDSFNESDWYRYQIKRLQETVDFIEETLLEYIEPK